MQTSNTPQEKAGLLEVGGGIKSNKDALAIRAGLEDLPGVHTVSFVGAAVKLTFDSQLVSRAQIYEAAKIVGFHPRLFHFL